MAMDEAEDRGHLHGYGDPDTKTTRLQEIVIQREKDVAEAKAKLPAAELEARAKAFAAEPGGGPQSLAECLEEAEGSAWRLALAAEFKRASPSKGDINVDLDAAAQALEYTQVGASVLSVLTEPKWFKGTLDDLLAVRRTTQRWAAEKGVRRPACLRKDFVIDEYQVVEAVAHGADTCLLMVSILPQTRLRALIACCRSWGLEPLVEVVNSRELKVALDADAKILGVNNRNLHTFELDKQRTAQLAQELRGSFGIDFGAGKATKLLALSGLATPEDINECRGISCSGVLIGEALMRAPDPGAAILELMGGTRDGKAVAAAAALPVAPGAVVVKVCGVVQPEDARCAVSAGANLIGVIFAKSKRQASVEQARAIAEVVRKFGERTDVVKAEPRSAVPATVEGMAERCAALRGACKRTPLVVGVFMDQPLDEVVASTEGAGCDAIQLHGGEDVEFVTQVRARLPNVWVFKVVHLPPSGDSEAADTGAAQLRERLGAYAAVCDGLLLDTAVKGSASGGTGQAFDWDVAKTAQDSWGIPIIVAGGLTDANVAELVAGARPFGVDVASGVEDAPGQKNPEKTTGYVRNAKRARATA